MVKASPGVAFAQNGKSTRGSSETVKVWPPPAEALLAFSQPGGDDDDEDVPIAELIRPTAGPGGAEEGIGSDAWSASRSDGSSPASGEE